MNDASCRNALAAFVEVRIEDWTGLPERGCAPELLQEPMPEEGTPEPPG